MRAMLIGIILLFAASVVAAQESIKLVPNFRIGPEPAAQCQGADLSPRHVTDDAAMGGHLLSDYAFKNDSLSACTLKGYPVFELLNKSAGLLRKGRAINSRKLMGDEAASDPQLVTIEPGKEAIFRVYSNNGGAGYTGKGCPTSRWVRIVAPGTTRAFVLKAEIRFCQAVKVSAVRAGSPE
ncbi:MAG: DUF4232 domain-containing protein [Pyrinomonadaceae bacterium]